MDDSKIIKVKWEDVYEWVDAASRRFVGAQLDLILGLSRGGIIPGMLLSKSLQVKYLTVEPFSSSWEFVRGKNVLVVDDIWDTGTTLRTVERSVRAAGAHTVAMIWMVQKHASGLEDMWAPLKPSTVLPERWVVFPWECSQDSVGGREQAVVSLLRSIGEDPFRDGLKDTPKRVSRMYDELFSGYKQDPAALLGTTFECSDYDEMIILKDISFQSWCEHHIQLFSGHAHVAYIPTNKVVGLSKLVRVVECFAHRLQIQERLTVQIGKAIEDTLNPKGVGVVIEAGHMCMKCRGVKNQDSVMVTSYLGGDFRTDPKTRDEFLKLVKGS